MIPDNGTQITLPQSALKGNAAQITAPIQR